MDSRDVEICRVIGQELYNASPDGAVKIIMRAELSLEEDACRFEYDYLNNSGVVGWFLPKNGMTDQKIRELLVQHRDFFVSQSQPPWKSCEFTLDVEKGKFSIQLSYD